MGYIYNVTFVASPEREPDLLNYLTGTLVPRVTENMGGANDLHLRKVMEIGGETPPPDHGVSIALSAVFNSKDEANAWKVSILEPALNDFCIRFGHESLYFVTLLEEIDFKL